MHCYVVKNEEMLIQLFHLLLGTILTKIEVKISLNKRIAPRCNCFIIQSSGTGKGEAQDAINQLVGEYNKKVENENLLSFIPKLEVAHRVSDFTTAGWIGSIERRRTVIYGMLKEKDIILVPEGKTFFEKREYVGDIRYKLTSALDEPGIIQKRTRLGEISYESTSSIAVATIPLPEIDMAISQEGFFQRFFISFREFSEKEKNEIDKEKEELKKLDYDRDIKPKLDNLVTSLIELAKSAMWAGFVGGVRIEECCVPEMERMRVALREKYFRHQYGDIRDSIVDSFYERLDWLLLELAAHHAVVEGKSQIDLEDYKYAVKAIEWHCESVGRLLDKIVGIKQDVNEKRKRFIYKILEMHGGNIVKKELFRELMQWRRVGEWDLGETRTHQFIKSMVSKHELRFRVGAHGRKVLLLP